MRNNLRYLILLPLVVIICFLLWSFKSIIAYVIIAAIISLIGQPIVKTYAKIRIGKILLPRSACAIFTLITIYVIGLLALSVTIPIVAKEAQVMASIDTEMLLQSLSDPIEWFESIITSFNIDLTDSNTKGYIRDAIIKIISSSNISTLLQNFINLTGDLVIAIFAISFISFFFLRDEKLFFNGLMTVVPSKYQSMFIHALKSTKHLLTRYFIGLCIQVAAVALLVTLGLWIFGVKNCWLIGLLAGLFNVIPYLGPIIGSVLGIIFGVASNLPMDLYDEMLPLIGQMALVFLVVQLLDNFVSQPLIYSNSVNAHPLEIFIVILMAGSLGGVFGMIVAIPTYTILRVFAREFLNKFEIVKKLTESLDSK